MSLLRLTRKPSFTISPDSTVDDAIDVMMRNRCGSVAIARDRLLVGIFTERDVMVRCVREGRDTAKTILSEVMTSDVRTIAEDFDVREAIKTMSEHRIRHLPIVDEDGRFLGMLGLRYLLHDRLEDLRHELMGLESYIGADGPGG